MLFRITSTNNIGSSSPLRDVSTQIQSKILPKENDQTNIPQAPFQKLLHLEGTHKFQMTDPARPPGSPEEPQMSRAPSREAKKHCIEVLIKTQHGQQGFVMHMSQHSLSESSLDLLSEIHICFSHDTTINGGLQGLQFFLCV